MQVVGNGLVSVLVNVLFDSMRYNVALAPGTTVERLTVEFLRRRSTSSERRRLPLGRGKGDGSGSYRRSFVSIKALVFLGRRAIATEMTGLAALIAGSREIAVTVGSAGEPRREVRSSAGPPWCHRHAAPVVTPRRCIECDTHLWPSRQMSI